MNSVISETPGPEVAVKARAPFQPAPIDHADRGEFVLGLHDGEACSCPSGSCGISCNSSAKASATEDDGVIGYQPQTVAPP
jgi:hypothetical protein